MDQLTPQFLSLLCKSQEAPCLSIYMPSCLTWPGVIHDSTRWKNVIRQAQGLLIARGLTEKAAKEFIRPILRLPKEQEFADTNAVSIAIFQSATLSAAVVLPIKAHEQVIVSSRFQVLPLIKTLAENGHFYVLALSKHETRLLEGQRGQLAELELSGIPQGADSVLHFDPRKPSLQAHGGVQLGKVERRTLIHGQGGPSDWSKEELKSYFRKIDRAIQGQFVDSKAPLILACVDYYEPLYREVNTYPYLQAENIGGNPESLSDREILKSAWHLVSSAFDEPKDAALRRCCELSDTYRFSTELEKILLAARIGQVESLFLAEDVPCWGVFDESEERLKVFDDHLPNSEDLMNLAAIETLNHGGEVLLVQAEDLPQCCEVAAIFRYEPADIDYVARLDQVVSSD